MHSRSARNCYCQTPVPIVCQRDEIRTERDCGRLNSNRSFPKTKADRCGRQIPWNSAKTLNEELLDSKRSTVSSPSTPVLSPETSTALENAERVLKDAHMQIKEIKLASSYNPTRTNVKVYSEEPPLDDNNDQLLYIRERVLFKFQEADRWIDDRNEVEHDGDIHDSTKRTIDLSAPKFKTLEKRYEQLFKRETFEVEENESTTERTEFRDSSIDDDTVYERNGKIIVETGKMQKKTLCIQAGPSVNIERKLVAQNLEEVHISPDSSVIPQSTNVGTYNFHQDFREENTSTTRREKCVRIVETNSCGDSSLITKSKSAEISKDNLRDNNVSTEKQEKLAEVEQSENKSLSNETKAPLLISNDLGVLQCNQREGKEINGKLEKPIHDISKNGRQGEIVNGTACDSIIKTVSRPDTRVEKDYPKVSTQFVQTDQPNGECHEIQLNDPSSYHRGQDIDIRESVSALSKEEKRKRKIEKHYNDINQRFAQVRKIHCNQHKETLKINDNMLLNGDTLESESESAGENSLYHPCMGELDDILITYNKMIDDICRDTRTIEKFLSRPEIAEYCISDDRTSSESCTSPGLIPLGKCKVEPTEAANPLRRLTKRNVESRSKNLMIRNQLATMNKEQQLPKISQTRITKTVQRKALLSTNGNKDSDKKKKNVVSGSLGKFAVHVQPSVTKRFRVLKKKLRNDMNEDTKESSIKNSIDKHLAIKYNDANRVHLLERGNQGKSYSLYPLSDSSGITSSMINPLSSCTEVEIQSLSDEKLKQKNCGSMIDDAATNLMNFKTNAASTRQHHKSEETDLQKGISGYSELYNIVENVIARVFQDEKQNLENKMKNTLKEAEIGPIVVKNLLEQFQGATLNSTIQNVELHGLKTFETHDSAVTRPTEHVDVQVISECQLTEHDLPIMCLEINENLVEGGTIKRNEKVTQENIVHRESACSSKNQSAVKKESTKSHSGKENALTTNEIEKACSDNESLNEISNIKSDENNGTEKVEVSNDQNDVHVQLKAGSGKNLKVGKNTHTSDANQDILDITPSISENKKTKSLTHTVLCENSPALHGNYHPLHDCTSQISTSPRHMRETSSNKMYNNDGITRQVSEINEASEVAIPFGDHIIDQQSDNHPLKKDTIKDAESNIGLHEDRSSNILPSTSSSNNSLPMSPRKGWNKIRVETPLEASYSEGELYMPSSCSYSLGEVRIVKRNDLHPDNATEYDNSFAVFVTQSMLNSWNESSNSLVESLGEV